MSRQHDCLNMSQSRVTANRHASMRRGCFRGLAPRQKKYRQLKMAANGDIVILTTGCTVTGHPIPNVSPEKQQLVKNEAMNLKENKEKFIGEFGGRKGKRKMMLIYYNLKSKKVIFIK